MYNLGAILFPSGSSESPYTRERRRRELKLPEYDVVSQKKMIFVSKKKVKKEEDKKKRRKKKEQKEKTERKNVKRKNNKQI